MHACTYVHPRMHMPHAPTHAHASRTCTCTCTHTCTHARTHTCTHPRTHACNHACNHTSTHAAHAPTLAYAQTKRIADTHLTLLPPSPPPPPQGLQDGGGQHWSKKQLQLNAIRPDLWPQLGGAQEQEQELVGGEQDQEQEQGMSQEQAGPGAQAGLEAPAASGTHVTKAGPQAVAANTKAGPQAVAAAATATQAVAATAVKPWEASGGLAWARAGAGADEAHQLRLQRGTICVMGPAVDAAAAVMKVPEACKAHRWVTVRGCSIHHGLSPPHLPPHPTAPPTNTY